MSDINLNLKKQQLRLLSNYLSNNNTVDYMNNNQFDPIYDSHFYYYYYENNSANLTPNTGNIITNNNLISKRNSNSTTNLANIGNNGLIRNASKDYNSNNTPTSTNNANNKSKASTPNTTTPTTTTTKPSANNNNKSSTPTKENTRNTPTKKSKTNTTNEKDKEKIERRKSKKILFNKSSNNEKQILKNLLKLNLKRDRIEKALAATAYQSQSDAINWLVRHANDPLINKNDQLPSTRDYILLLCPVGALADEISNFLKLSSTKCGNNEAHYNNLLPFMKLTTFFQLNDAEIINLHRAFDYIFKYKELNNFNFSLTSKLNAKNLSSSSSSVDSNSTSSLSLNSSSSSSSSENSELEMQEGVKLHEINIDLHASPQMIVLYPDIESENIIKEMVQEFTDLVTELQQRILKKSTKSTKSPPASLNDQTPVMPYTKQLHLTLSAQFSTENKRVLEDLAYKCINYKNASDWEIRLYSRDSRIGGRYVS